MVYSIEKASKEIKLVTNPRPLKASKKVKTPKYFKKVFKSMKTDLAR